MHAQCRRAAAGLVLACASGTGQALSPHWQGADVTTLAFVREQPDVVFAAGAGLFKSVDGGRNWQVLGDPSNDHVYVDPHDGRRVLLFSHRAGYRESLDQGKTWVQQAILPAASAGAAPTDFRGFVAHGGVPGLWLVRFGGRVYTTATAGREWSIAPGAPDGLVQVVEDGVAFHLLAGGALWTSPDGERWTRQDGPDGNEVEAIAALGAGRPAVRTVRGWLARTRGQVWAPFDALTALEQRQGGAATTDRRRPVQDACQPQASAADARLLFAVCPDASWSQSIFRSVDGGVSWRALETADGSHLRAIALHPQRPGTLLVGWLGGRMSRTDDGGASWQASQDGLVWPKGVIEGDEWLRETPIARAVIARDGAALARALAAGENPNQVGPLGRTPLEWAVSMGYEYPQVNDAFYSQLRAAGAKPRRQGEGPRLTSGMDMLRTAEHGGMPRVVKDLLAAGWRRK